MASINKRLHGELEICFYGGRTATFCGLAFREEIALFNGDVSSFVPKNVANALQRKMQERSALDAESC